MTILRMTFRAPESVYILFLIGYRYAAQPPACRHYLPHANVLRLADVHVAQWFIRIP
jgi:hypothetical protein